MDLEIVRKMKFNLLLTYTRSFMIIENSELGEEKVSKRSFWPKNIDPGTIKLSRDWRMLITSVINQNVDMENSISKP